MSEQKFTPAGTSGLILNEKLLWEKGRKGREAISLVKTKAPKAALPAGLAGNGPDWPDLSELEVVRHYTRLSSWNFGIDTGMYPLGSCTMKYNPVINECMASLPGFAHSHPLLPAEASQGAMQLIYELEKHLAEIVGLKEASMQPAAGAHGELCGMLMIAAYHRENEKSGAPRKTKVLMPDTSHGTNPATASMCGFTEIKVPLGPKGYIELEEIEKLMADDVAGLMITNPNTLGLFERNLAEIIALIHERGGLVYADGANLNAVMGYADLGRMGVDVVHYNLHKTMSTPHGGGGPGAGPVAVGDTLTPFLPGPRIVKKGDKFEWNADLPLSIGRLHGFHGQFGVGVRAYSYILSMGENLKKASALAVLNANYIKEKLKSAFDLPFDGPCMHECVFTDAKQRDGKVTTLDIAKRLIDFGYHPPTVFFPLVVNSAIMIEPTETESKEELDAFIEAMLEIAREARENPEALREAPTLTKVRRMDETTAARKPILTGDMK